MRINLLAFSADRELLTSLDVLSVEEDGIVISPVSTIDELRGITLQQRFHAALIDAADSEIPTAIANFCAHSIIAVQIAGCLPIRGLHHQHPAVRATFTPDQRAALVNLHITECNATT